MCAGRLLLYLDNLKVKYPLIFTEKFYYIKINLYFI